MEEPARLRRTNQPWRGNGEVQCSDRWARKLGNGLEAYVALWLGPDDEHPYYLEIVFRSPDGKHIRTVRCKALLAQSPMRSWKSSTVRAS
jgi:hypothetical protein